MASCKSRGDALSHSRYDPLQLHQERQARVRTRTGKLRTRENFAKTESTHGCRIFNPRRLVS
jgi:hypothetical protein